MSSRKELRQMLIDVGILFKDFESKFKQIKEEVNEETEKKIDALIRKKFNIEAKNKIVKSKDRVSKKTVNRMMKEIRREVYKKESLDFFEIIDAIKKLPKLQKLDILEYTLQRLQIETLQQRMKLKQKDKVIKFSNFTNRQFLEEGGNYAESRR